MDGTIVTESRSNATVQQESQTSNTNGTIKSWDEDSGEIPRLQIVDENQNFT